MGNPLAKLLDCWSVLFLREFQTPEKFAYKFASAGDTLQDTLARLQEVWHYRNFQECCLLICQLANFYQCLRRTKFSNLKTKKNIYQIEKLFIFLFTRNTCGQSQAHETVHLNNLT
jgi:hypothetical protein